MGSSLLSPVASFLAAAWHQHSTYPKASKLTNIHCQTLFFLRLRCSSWQSQSVTLKLLDPRLLFAFVHVPKYLEQRNVL